MNEKDTLIESLYSTLDQKQEISETNINKILYLHGLAIKHLDIFCKHLQQLLSAMIESKSMNIEDYNNARLEDSNGECLLMLIHNQVFIWQLLNIKEAAEEYYNKTKLNKDDFEKALNYFDLNYLPNMSKHEFKEKSNIHNEDVLNNAIDEIYYNLFTFSPDSKENSETLLPIASQICRRLYHSTIISRPDIERIVDSISNPSIIKKAKEIIQTGIKENNQLIDKDKLIPLLNIKQNADMASYRAVELMLKTLSSRQELADISYPAEEKIELIEQWVGNKYNKLFAYGLSLPENKEIGLNIRKLRKDKGWTQEELAHEVNCTKQYISDIEKGNKNPSRKILGLIASMLGSTIDLLYGWSDSPTKDYAGFTDAIAFLEISDDVIKFDDFHNSFYRYPRLSQLYMHCVVLLKGEQLDNVCDFLESALKIYGNGETTNQEVNKIRKEKNLARMGTTPRL